MRGGHTKALAGVCIYLILFFCSMNDRTIIGGVVVVLLAVGVLLFVTGDPVSTPSSDTVGTTEPAKVATGPNLPLAQCIKDSGAVFYGAFWCPHCKSQEALFADAGPALPYVECSTPDGNGQTFVCKEQGIKSYPTWKFTDGSELTGEQSFKTLAEKTGCSAALPGAESSAAPVATTSVE